MKRNALWTVGFLVVAGLLVALASGCAGAPAAPTPTTAPAATKAPAAATAAPAATKAPEAPKAPPEATKAPAAQAPAAQAPAGKTYTVGISQLMPHKVLDAFRAGFIQGLNEDGFTEGKNLKIDYQNAQGDINTAKTIADKFVADKVDLILTITTPASLAAAKATTSIPVVVGYVTDPVAAGIVKQLDKPGGNVTGVHVLDPVKEQIDLVKEVVPNAKNLGTVYNPGETNSRVLVGLIKKNAEALGMKVVEATVSNPSEVSTAAKSLVGRVDAIFITGDNTTQSALSAVVKVGEENKIPVLTSDLGSVDLGAIATFNFQEKEIGIQTGKVAARVLKGEKPGDITIEGPKKHILVVNPGAAERMGIKLSDAILKRAERVVK